MERLVLEGKEYRLTIAGDLQSHDYIRGEYYEHKATSYWWRGCGKIESKVTGVVVLFNYNTVTFGDWCGEKWYRDSLEHGVVMASGNFSGSYKEFILDRAVDREAVIDIFCQNLKEQVEDYSGDSPVPFVKIGGMLSVARLQEQGLMPDNNGQVRLAVGGE